jgi:pseudouridine-5'-phosphate glycosidase
MDAIRHLVIADEVRNALDTGTPVVAFESTVLTHGLPYPKSVELALRVEEIARQEQCVPATIGIIDGVIHVGMAETEVDRLAGDGNALKASSFDLAYAIGAKKSAGTTVSGTLTIAERVGVKVFATGGIGGVHRGAEETFDISHDLKTLARSRVITVCAGAKAILDLPKTLEYLETEGVCVIGYKTKTLPAFYSRDSGLPLAYSADSFQEIADVYIVREQLNLPGGILVVAPLPEEKELPFKRINSEIEKALEAAAELGIRGKDVPPFLLARLADTTKGRSVESNLALLENNARVAAGIARSIAKTMRS